MRPVAGASSHTGADVRKPSQGRTVVRLGSSPLPDALHSTGRGLAPDLIRGRGGHLLGIPRLTTPAFRAQAVIKRA